MAAEKRESVLGRGVCVCLTIARSYEFEAEWTTS